MFNIIRRINGWSKQHAWVGQPERKRIIVRHKRKFFALLECHAALIGRYIQTFRDNISAPSSPAKQSKKNIQWGNSIIINFAETE